MWGVSLPLLSQTAGELEYTAWVALRPFSAYTNSPSTGGDLVAHSIL